MTMVECVNFSFMSDEEVKNLSVVNITKPDLVDVLDRAIPGGLFDPAMGPLHDETLCKTCGQRALLCNGHCGHIELVLPSYNPLLFDKLCNLLNITCLYCFHFRSSKEEVENSFAQLKLIEEGDIVGAKKVRLRQKLHDQKKNEFGLPDDIIDQEDSQGSHTSHDAFLSEDKNYNNHNRQASWNSFQLTEAMSVLNEFLKKKQNKCMNCKRKNPKIVKPTFGWFHVTGNSSVEIRSNAVRSGRLDATESGGCEDKALSEVVNTSDYSCMGELEVVETYSFNAASDSSKKRSKKSVNEKTNLYQQSQDTSSYLSGHLLPTEVRDILRHLWKNEASICSYISDIQQRSTGTGYSMFFLETILVPPIKFRPPAKGGDSVMEHPNTNLLGKILQSNIALRNAYNFDAERPRIIRPWMDLQQSINVFFDGKNATGQSQKDGFLGLCQILEKKEGIFRQNMMGKRVNYAARSVISPDPYLPVNVIGIPLSIARKLTYPERVTPYNAAKLRDAVINGPEVHPGAITYADSAATVKLPPSQKMRTAISRKLPSSRGIDAQSGKTNEQSEDKIVYRHLQNWDCLLVNRQPTLHKPGIMAMFARVMEGEITMRMNYPNCSSFNADFDGDEINVHFPQNELARAEAHFIVNADEQYIVPTRGDTVRGLIQDHIVSAVILTMKNTFFTRSEFSHLLYASGVFAVVPGLLPANYSRKVSVVDSEGVIETILPTIWKPVPLWTGKQVITALLNHITRGCDPCTVKVQGKIPKNYFTGNHRNGEEDADHNAEHELLIWKNELVRGLIDKSQFGNAGLVHTVQESYGSNTAGILLSALSRLFTIFLQFHGFTCGLDDLIILPNHDAQRKEKLDGEDVGEEVHCEFVNFESGQIGPEELQLEIEKVISSDKESATASLDVKMKNKLTNRLTREDPQILKHLLTTGLLKPFPKNCVSVMTTTGAKGSTVNFQQISAYLGQQELEGKRVPRMVSGKTLPSFPPWDFTSRAGGFITDRFLTGLRPQEYYFHCMAGREGLVDTAVKTSRSGYLQRCLVKNLESLKVCYDYTVRDADGSVVQFYYGEDGVDVHHTSFLKNFKALKDNQDPFRQKFENTREFNSYISKLPERLEDEAKCFIQEALDTSLEKQNSSAMKHLHEKGKENTKEVLSKKDKAFMKEQDRFLELVKQKYLSSLAQPGEPVGVIAAQSVGEPSTQMTLNTFHLAGRGEMNVTLGIPRLQEILMTASDVIKTPMLTCPFSEWRSKCDVVSLVSSVKKVKIADLVENMEVGLAIEHHQVARIYKLTMKLKATEFVSLEDTHDTLKTVFIRELEDAIENHVIFLSRINGIKHVISSSRSEASSIADDDASGARSKEVDDDGDDDDGHGVADDLGSDAQKRKLQSTDEMDYDDGSDVDYHSEDGISADQEKNKSNLDCEKDIEENNDDEESEHSDDRDKSCDAHNVDDVTSIAKSKSKSSCKKDRATSKIFEKCSNLSGKKIRRAVHMEVKGLSFVVHFRFTSEPHMLLAQIAQKTAKKVYIKKSGKISQCKLVQYDPDEKTVIWDDEEKPKGGQQTNEAAYWAVKASGVDFKSIWEIHDDLDLNRLYSNDINTVLKTYGVEAARATLIREVKQVFDIYGVKIDYRHLSLIADYMTHTGGYRPMSRHGGITDSVSPMLKMSFETASKFIVEAASLGLTDDLETPSSRICLGLPVKMGTGSFDLMHA